MTNRPSVKHSMYLVKSLQECLDVLGPAATPPPDGEFLSYTFSFYQGATSWNVIIESHFSSCLHVCKLSDVESYPSQICVFVWGHPSINSWSHLSRVAWSEAFGDRIRRYLSPYKDHLRWVNSRWKWMLLEDVWVLFIRNEMDSHYCRMTT